METGNGKSYQQTDLWRVFKEKASQEGLGTDFISGVGEICERGENLSKTVIAFFPTFTLHDATHLSNVSQWMLELLGDYAEKLTAEEAAYLLMSAWCHDIGMAVKTEGENELRKNFDTEQWKAYFDSHFDAQQEYHKTESVSDETLRDFIRTCHAQRSGEKIRGMQWPNALTLNRVLQNDVADLCASHGLKLEDVRPDDDSFRRCAALLRLADLLDYDTSRAPADLFVHMGLDSPFNEEQRVSRAEWDKNRVGKFQMKNGTIRYDAISDSLQLEKEIGRYLAYVQDELVKCNKFLSGNGDWKGFAFPDKLDIQINPEGYKPGDFRITMDQDRVLQLLTGEKLYSDEGVFVRELLQNSIDAVLTRRRVDPNFGRDKRTGKKEESPGKILIDTWSADGYDWFRIEDDGIGMTEDIITNYFLKVGCSYYTSDEFKKEQSYAESEYTPISRFGIGVLSCFMADPENSLLQVSTKRYHPDKIKEHPAIRLDMDNLSNYYNLVTNQEVRYAKPMPIRKGEADNQFRKKPGTTICVRTNLRHLGYSSFREILDKYIRFPEVEIKHCAWGKDNLPDRKTYPTQQELMRLLHEKNPDGSDKPLQEHYRLFSEALFTEVQKLTPDFVWERRPELVLRFQPLDWLDESGNLNGYAILMNVRGEAHSKPFDFDGETIQAKLVMNLVESDFRSSPEKPPVITFRASFPKGIRDKIRNIRDAMDVWKYAAKEIFKKSDSDRVSAEDTERFYREYPDHTNDPQWKKEMSKTLKTPLKKLDAKYQRLRKQVEEASALREKYAETLEYCKRLDSGKCSISAFFRDTLKKDPLLKFVTPLMKEQFRSDSDEQLLFDNTPIFAACNGIAIPSFQNDELPEICHTLCLLSGSYRPELNLARDKVLALPPEAFYALSHVFKALPGSFDELRLSTFSTSGLWLLPEREFRRMCERHPSWEAHLCCERYLEEKDSWQRVTLKELQNLISAGKSPATKVKFESFYFGNSESDCHFYLPALAVAKACFNVRREFNPNGYFHISAGKMDCGTDDFPPGMFFLPYEPCEVLGYVGLFHHNYYNCEHKFSQWLIANGEAMRKKRRAEAIFRRLLDDMLTIQARKGLAKAIDSALNDLKRLPGNPFSISGELYVSEDDLLTESDFE